MKKAAAHMKVAAAQQWVVETIQEVVTLHMWVFDYVHVTMQVLD